MTIALNKRSHMIIVVNAFPKDPVVFVFDVCLYFRFITLIDLMY